MPLNRFGRFEEYLVGTPVRKQLVRAKETGGSTLIFCPSMAVALCAQRELEAAGLAFNVTCTTPNNWAKLRWDLYGDGRAPVKPSLRIALIAQLMEGDIAPLSATVGTVQLLASVAEQMLPWVDADTPALSVGEKRAAKILLAYKELLAAKHMVEPAEALALLPGMLAEQGMALPPCAFVGFSEFSYAQEQFAQALSVHAAVLIQDEALGKKAPASSVRPAELQQLIDSLLVGRAGVLEPMGAVELLEPAGPVAVAEATSQYIQRLARAGAQRIVVVSQDVRSTWRELAPKLYAAGISVRAQLTTHASKARASAGFIRFAGAVAHLDELAQKWPAEPSSDYVDMSWWPPHDIIDFLLAQVSGIDIETVWRRDAAWRGNRILTPQSVIATLENPSATSPAIAAATREILKGHLAAAAGYIMRAQTEPTQDAASQGQEGINDSDVSAQDAPKQLVYDALSEVEDSGALTALSDIGQALKAAGIELGSKGMTLPQLVGYADLLSCCIAIIERPELVAEGASCAVSIVDPATAAQMSPCSADALVYLNLDSVTTAIATKDGAKDNFLAHLGAQQLDALTKARMQFEAIMRVPKQKFALLKTLFDAKAEETYPAVMLSEVLALYEQEGEGGKRECLLTSEASSRLDEGALGQNLSASAPGPEPHVVEGPAGVGHLDESLRRFVVPPRDGQAENLHPSLSASQIESYLECPFKWFTLRRLGLDNADAGFSNMEMGTFAHRVLEVSHRTLLFEAAAAQGLIDAETASHPENSALPEGELFWFDPRVRLSGSRVTLETLEHAKEVLSTEFDEHLLHQKLEGSQRSKQALVPHTQPERRRLAKLEEDLLSTLEFEMDKFEGFEPRLFEGRFGGKSGLKAEYAGAELVGTIDRIDVDVHGHALVIDYKHKSSLFDEYALLPRGEVDWESGFKLPRRVQTLIYAAVAKRLLAQSGLEVVGAVYLGTRGNHEIAGASSVTTAGSIWPAGAITAKNLERTCTPVPGARDFNDLLERTEEGIAEAIERMRAGYIEANPSTEHACDFCPVQNCERRRS